MRSEKLKRISLDEEWAKSTKPPTGISFDKVANQAKGVRGQTAFKVGHLSDPKKFSSFDTGTIHHFAQSLKKPGSYLHSINDIYSPFAEAIQKIASYEAMHSQYAHYKSATLTLRRNWLYAGSTQSLGDSPWHRDGNKLSELKEPHYLDHIYIVCNDNSPTLVQDRPLMLPNRTLTKAGNTAPVKGVSRQIDPYTIYLFNSYCWHASTRVKEDGVREFLRVIYYGLTKAKVEEIRESGKLHPSPF